MARSRERVTTARMSRSFCPSSAAPPWSAHSNVGRISGNCSERQAQAFFHYTKALPRSLAVFCDERLSNLWPEGPDRLLDRQTTRHSRPGAEGPYQTLKPAGRAHAYKRRPTCAAKECGVASRRAPVANGVAPLPGGNSESYKSRFIRIIPDPGVSAGATPAACFAQSARRVQYTVVPARGPHSCRRSHACSRSTPMVARHEPRKKRRRYER